MEINYFNRRNTAIEWNKFVIENQGSFLQSFEWGEFQKKFCQNIWRLEIKDGEKILLISQIIQKKIKFKAYFYIPYGPVLLDGISAKEKQEAFNLFLKELQKLAQTQGAIFLRIEPVSVLPDLQGFNCKNLLNRVQPRKTLVLDLQKTENQIFNGFNKRTRYNIRLAERKAIKMKISGEYPNVFYRLLNQTKQRQKFRSHEEAYYKELLNIETQDFKTRVFLAEYNNKIATASIVVFFGERATSLHMASDYKYRAMKTPDFLHWQKILFAKNMGYKEYDFWGIDEKKWPGITYFKKGFGGKEFVYAQNKDIIFQNHWYQIYSILRNFL